MNRLLIGLGLALAPAAVHAQERPALPAPVSGPQEAHARAFVSGYSEAVYHGPHRYAMQERGRHPGDPPIIDHSADTLVVEPTHSTITVTIPSPAP